MAPVRTLQSEANYPKQAKNNNSVLRFKVKLFSKTRMVNAEDDEEKAIITDYVTFSRVTCYSYVLEPMFRDGKQTLFLQILHITVLLWSLVVIEVSGLDVRRSLKTASY